MKRSLAREASQLLEREVRICGWVNTVRSHGKIIFVDLRDRSGLVQVVFAPNLEPQIYKSAQTLRPEWVIEVIGKVQKRPRGMENPKIKSGEIEISATKLKIFSRAKTLPFPIDTDGYEIKEEKRLKYRYLDLRRKRMQKNLKMRQKVIQLMREFLQERDFVEVETPILTKSTPEGARDFIVPSRLHPGKFYALPQSPQQYKQLLMVAGLERYFQVAKCFRDEDPRADRQPVFTQLDIEMSFVDQEEILSLIEELYIKIIRTLFPEKKITKIPFPRIPCQEAMEKYKTDRPDIRKNKQDKNELGFCFIIDFPLFEKTVEKEISPSHHPFTAPKDEDIPLLDSEPMKVRSWQHDFVCNGWEIAGGSIRITNPEIQTKIFKILGHTQKEIEEKFGHLLRAFEYGVPPHGGIAPGIDRFLAIVLGEPNIREVIAFPKTGDFRGLMMNTPSEIAKKQLKELHIKPIKKKRKSESKEKIV